VLLIYLQDGNGVVRGNYLSVFLELSTGLPETSKYASYDMNLKFFNANETLQRLLP
jgi:hypothetical protein